MTAEIATPTLDATGATEMPMALFWIGGLGAFGEAHQTEPPTVELPAPVFGSWDEAVAYARAAFLRLRWLSSQVPAREEAIGAAQIEMADTLEELRLLQVAATQLLAQGTDLA